MPYRNLCRLALTEHPLRANEILQQQVDAISSHTGEQGNRANDTGTRILLIAELATPTSLVRQIEAAGARVVAEVSDLDELSTTPMVAERGETLEDLLLSLAETYLTKPPAPRTHALSQRFAYIARLAHERAVHAIICAYSKFCDLPLAEYPLLRAEMERIGVPVLLLELEDEALSGQQRTRVEAFLEMTRHV